MVVIYNIYLHRFQNNNRLCNKFTYWCMMTKNWWIWENCPDGMDLFLVSMARKTGLRLLYNVYKRFNFVPQKIAVLHCYFFRLPFITLIGVIGIYLLQLQASMSRRRVLNKSRNKSQTVQRRPTCRLWVTFTLRQRTVLSMTTMLLSSHPNPY